MEQLTLESVRKMQSTNLPADERFFYGIEFNKVCRYFVTSVEGKYVAISPFGLTVGTNLINYSSQFSKLSDFFDRLMKSKFKVIKFETYQELQHWLFEVYK